MKETTPAIAMGKTTHVLFGSDPDSNNGLDKLELNVHTMLRVFVEEGQGEKHVEYTDLKCGSMTIFGGVTSLKFLGDCSALKTLYIELATFKSIDLTNTNIEKVFVYKASTEGDCMWLKGADRIKELVIKNDNPFNNVPIPNGITELDRLEIPVRCWAISKALKKIKVSDLTLTNLYDGYIPKMRYSSCVTKLVIITEIIDNVNYLSSFTNLEKLALRCSNKLSLDALSYLNLKKLVLDNDHVSDLSFMKNMVELRSFYLLGKTANDLSDIYHLNKI